MIVPSDVHAGRYDGDDVDLAANAVLEAAFVVEPVATAKVQAAAAATGGAVERADSQLKTRSSVLAKLTRFRSSISPRYRLERFNDALRYTIVFIDLSYWRAAEATVGEFQLNGWSVKDIARGWTARGYKGLNLTIITPGGFHFEVQLHTSQSLATAERTHRLYAEQRDLSRRSKRWRELERIQQEAWNTVPVPPGRLELP